MDWYSWLGKAGLAPAVTYEYGRLFSDNELEPGDAPHFDHDLLKSMGIAVAKHRLEILKLAKKDAVSSSASSSSCARRLARRAGRCLARCARRLGGRGSSSVTVVPRICNVRSDDVVRVGAVQQRRGAGGVKKMVLMITDGGAGTRASSHKANLMFHDFYAEEEDDEGGEEDEPCSGGAGTGGGEIKWDSMFQDLKPT